MRGNRSFLPRRRESTFTSLEREIAARGPLVALTRLKNEGRRPDIARETKSLSRDPSLAEWVIGIPFPKKLTQLQKTPLLRYRTLQAELFWSACILRLFPTELNRFVALRAEFSEAMLATDYQKAEQTLDTVHSELGYSIWYIENRIALLAASGGLERQKEFSASIVRNDEIPSSVRLLARYFSIRAEPTVSPNRFTLILDQFLQGYAGLGISVAQYYRFRLDFFGEHDLVEFLPQILLLDSNAALVDRYLTFVRVAQLIVAANPNTRSLRAVTDAIDVIQPQSTDPSLFNLCAILGVTPPQTDLTLAQDIHALVEEYTQGEYEACASRAERLLQQHPSLIEVCEIYAKTVIRMGAQRNLAIPFAAQTIVEHLRNVLLLAPSAPVSVSYLLKLASVNTSHSFAAQIYSFLMQEYRHDRRQMAERLIIFGELNSYPGNPRLYVFVRRASFPAIYPAHVENRRFSPRAHRLMDILSNSKQIHPDSLNELGLPEPRLLKYRARLLDDRGDHEQALKIYSQLLSDPGSSSYYENLLPAVRSFLSAGMLDKALRLTVSAYLTNRHVAARLPIRELIERLEAQGSTHFRSMIEVPILYELFYVAYSGAKELERADACEDFLNYHAVGRPSHLRSAALEIDPAALIYFLRHVAVLEVLDSSVEFQSTEDVQQERIQILQALREMDPERTEEYSNEIRALTTTLAVARGLREVEQSRIYVDAAGVKRTVEGVLRDSYARYNDLLRHTPDTFDAKKLMLALSKIDDLAGVSVSVFLPADEKFDLFKSMVLDIRDKFVSSNEYGLDSSLSMGFRHGTLSGQLRPRLEAAHLITLKDSKTNTYKQNEYWARLLEGESTSAAVLERLNQFSADVDGLIDEINNRVIQIHTENRPSQGLFDFRLSSLFIKGLQFRVRPDTDFDEFFAATIDELWARTDECLEKVRAYMLDTIKPRFERLFDTLSHDLSLRSSGPLQPIFDTIIQAKIDTQYNLDRVRSWFARTTADEAADFQARLPIDIGLETVHNVYLEQPVEPIYEIDQTLRFRGKTLSALTNIMFMLCDNVRKYAALEGGVRRFKCRVHNEAGNVVFDLSNAIASDVDPIFEDARLEEIRTAIRSTLEAGRIAGDSVKKEGRSGFHKIAKVLLFDLGCMVDLNFGYEGGIFRVRFALPSQQVIA